MKYLKIFGLIVTSIIVLFLIVAIFMPSGLKIERSININKPINLVFEQAADLNKFNKWNSWVEMEPTAYLPVKGAAGLGQISEWSGDTIGNGSLTNVKVVQNKYIEQDLKFIKPWEFSSKIYFKFSENNGVTTVTWVMKGNLSYPIERIMKVKMETELSKSFNKGLANLKKLCENIN
jgi:hypothetical protein